MKVDALVLLIVLKMMLVTRSLAGLAHAASLVGHSSHCQPISRPDRHVQRGFAWMIRLPLQKPRHAPWSDDLWLVWTSLV